jgi:hypothetical protein
MTLRKKAPVAKTPHAKRSAKSPARETIELPDEATLTELGRRLKLSTTQVVHLRITLQHVHADLADHQANRVYSERTEIVRRLKLVETALADLNNACRQHAKHIGHFPSEFLGGVGAMLTFVAMNDALGQDRVPRQVDRTIQECITAGGIRSVEQIESLTQPAREALAIQYGAELVPAIIARLHAPLKTWVDLNRLNRGGRKTNLARLYLVTCLTQSAPKIIGRKAGQSQTGPFVRLCEAVLSACGIAPDGVEKLIPRIVKSTNAAKKG